MGRLLALALMVLVAAVVAPAALGAKYIVRANLLKDSRVENASSTAGVGYKLPDVRPLAGPKPGGLANAPASGADTFSAL